MFQDRLTKAVMRRLKELGLPSSLLEVEGFRDKFVFGGWLMLVRNGDKVADVHLIQPPPTRKPRRKASTIKLPEAIKRLRRKV
jgi:hypothetical protein